MADVPGFMRSEGPPGELQGGFELRAGDKAGHLRRSI